MRSRRVGWCARSLNSDVRRLPFLGELRIGQFVVSVWFTRVFGLDLEFIVGLQSAERREVLVEGGLQIKQQVSVAEPHVLNGLSCGETFQRVLKTDERADDSVAELQQVPQDDRQNRECAEPQRMVLLQELAVEVRKVLSICWGCI